MSELRRRPAEATQQHKNSQLQIKLDYKIINETAKLDFLIIAGPDNCQVNVEYIVLRYIVPTGHLHFFLCIQNLAKLANHIVNLYLLVS